MHVKSAHLQTTCWHWGPLIAWSALCWQATMYPEPQIMFKDTQLGSLSSALKVAIDMLFFSGHLVATITFLCLLGNSTTTMLDFLGASTVCINASSLLPVVSSNAVDYFIWIFLNSKSQDCLFSLLLYNSYLWGNTILRKLLPNSSVERVIRSLMWTTLKHPISHSRVIYCRYIDHGLL